MKKIGSIALVLVLVASLAFGGSFSFRDEFHTARGPSASGAVTLANIRLSLVNGTAFVDFSAADVLTGNIGKYLVITSITDPTQYAVGYIKAAGSSESLGNELVTNGTFSTDTTGWTNRATLQFDTFEISGGKLHLAGNGDGTPAAYYVYSDDNISLVAGALYKKSLDVTVTSGAGVQTCLRQTGTSGTSTFVSGAITASKTDVFYGLATATEEVTFQLYQSAGAATDVLIDNASVKQVIAPSATGVTIVSTAGGTTYNWAANTFTTQSNDAAGFRYAIYNDATMVLNGSNAENGPGTRTVTDTENKLSIANGSLTFSGGKGTPGAGDPTVWFPAITRAPGKAIISDYVSSTAGKYSYIGWDVDTTGALTGGVARANTVFSAYAVSPAPSFVEWASGVTFYFATILRATGEYVFYKTTGKWLLGWEGKTSNFATIYPVISSYNDIFTSSFLRIPSVLWLPSPLASAGFTGDNGTKLNTTTTGGDGHAETTGLGSGGSGLAWSAQDTWTISSNKAINTPVLGANALTNGNFSDATYTDSSVHALVGWTNAGTHNATNKFTIADGACSITSDGTWTGINALLTTDVWYMVTLPISAISGTIKWSNNYNEVSYSTTGTKIASFRAASGSLTLGRSAAGTPVTATFDNITMEPLTLNQLFSSVTISTSDVISTVSIAASPSGTQAGLVLNLDSVSDPQNFVIATHDGIYAKLEKHTTAGGYTSVISAAATWANGAELRVVKDGTSYRLYYNNAQVGATSTIDDAGIISNTKHGLFSTYSGNQLDNFTVYSRGSNGEYDGALNVLMAPTNGGFRMGKRYWLGY